MKLSARFPEDLWQIQQKEDRAIYNDQVKRGYELMPSLSFCVVGLARNIENEIVFSLDRIDALRQATDLYWVIYTNDNDDKTREILQNRRTKKDVLIYEELKKKFHGSVACKNRYADMAYYRNKYLDHIDGTDYTIVIDLDTDGFSYDGLAQSIFFMETQDIDCIGSNSLLYRQLEEKIQRLYYDTLAFRRTNRQWGVPHPGEEINLMNLNRGEKLLKVQSCFGGLAIYKTESIKRYKYKDDDCDHVTINRYLSNVYVNPSQIVLFGDNPYSI